MTIIAIDPGLDGAAAILHDGGELIEEFDLPTTGESEGAQRRLDAANLAYLIGGHGPMLSPSSSRPARALDRESCQCSGSGRRAGRTWRHRRAGHPHPPDAAGEVEKGAWPRQRRRNVTRPGDRDVAGPG